MQQDKPLTKFINLLNNHLIELQQLQQHFKTYKQFKKYELKELLNFYQKQFISKLNKRNKVSQVFSDIIVWFTPNLLVTFYKIDIVVKKILPQLIKVQVLQHQENHQISESLQLPNIQQMLKTPRNFIAQNMITLIKQCAQLHYKMGNKQETAELIHFVETFQKLMKEQPNIDITLPLEQYEGKIISLLFPKIENTRSRIIVKFGYRFLFLAKLKIRVIKANKHINQRKLRIQQLIQGQRKYINGLTQYIQYIKNPICNLKILSELQNKKLFSTIQSILAFHRYLEQQLTARFVKYHKYQTYGDLIKKNIPFFKLYTDYIQYADQAQAMLLKLQQINQQVRAICNKFMIQKQKKASDELKQPTFRIARYSMIISQILKNTSNTHPDYQLLKQAQKQASTNLSKINQTVDSIARRTRLHQLQQQFGTEQRPIYTPQRNFIQQFHVHYINNDKLQPVFIFIFNDLVMVVDQNRKLLKQIKINSNFYVRREQDNKTYRNLVKIHSDGFDTFSAGNQDRHFAKADSLYKILKGLTKATDETDRLINVHVIGTQQINSSTFNKYTEYIAEIKYLGMRKFSRLRFSKMKDFVLKVQHFYKNNLGIILDQGFKDGWFSNYNSKTIQDRKRAIQQILQKLLNHKIVRDDPQFILNQLGIQPSFLKTVQPSQRKRQIKDADEVLSPLLRTRSNQNKSIREAETILCAAEIKLGRDSYHDPQFINKKVAQSQRYTIYIHTMVVEEPMAVKISQLYTVQDVCYEVSNILDLKTNRDFRLFHQAGRKELRVLDNEKKIIKLFGPESFKKQSGSISSFSSILDVVKSYILPQTTPKLIFKKYYFLPTQIQQSQCRKDIVRLRLIVYQIFAQIKDMKYNLIFEDYLFFLAVLIYIEYDGEVPEQTQTTYVSRVIPQKIFKIKNETGQYWLQQCRPHMLWLREQINKIIEYNKQKVKSKRIRQGSIIHFSHRHLCSQLAINKIRSNSIYGSNLFYVQLSKQTYQKFEKEGKKPVYNMWLAIKFNTFMLLSPTSKETLLQADLKNIDRIVVQTQGVIFKFQGLSSTQYSLNTYQSFEISELVKYYKCVDQTLEELQNNKLLIQKTRVYKKQLNQYRNSYEKAQRQTMAVQSTKEQILQVLGLYN